MATKAPHSEWLRFYHGAFLRAVHQLLSWGYQDARTKIHASALEETITGYIVEAVKDRLDNPATPRRYTKHYFVDDETHVRGSTRKGRARQRLDIVAVCSSKLPRPEFIFEAKLLRKNGFPISLYAGSGGMQAFIQGEYAANYPAAAMIGYMQTDDASRWIKELERRFRNDKKGVLGITRVLTRINVVRTLHDEWFSTHHRTLAGDIELFHIFLDCT